MLRHEYERIEGVRIWYMLQDDLPPLKTAVAAAMQKLEKDKRP